MRKLFINIIKKTILLLDPELKRALGLVYSTSRYDFIFHYINLRLCQTIYKLRRLFHSRKNNQNYFLFENTSLTNAFSDIAQHMKDNIENERKQKKKRHWTSHVRLTNYTFTTYDPDLHQFFYDYLPQALLNKLTFSLEKSGLFAECSKIMNTNFTVSQTRAWLFFTSNNKNNTPIQKHYDMLPPGTLKIMYYQGRFTEDLPALTLHPINSNPVKIVGDDPILIFNSCAIEHEAPFPERIRPTIEITLTPSVKNSYEVIQAGYMAGAKYNPFLKSNANITVMRTK